MKRSIVMFFLIAGICGGICGCTGINTSTATNIATDTALAAVLQNNPEYKPAVVSALKGVKVFLEGKVTYAELLAEVSRRFDGKYAYVGVIIAGYLDADKPVFESNIALLDSYKEAVSARLDRWILLASL